MKDVSRRQFVGGSVAGSLALAGCSGVPGISGDSGSGGDGESGHLLWFGPEVVKTQWSTAEYDLEEPIPESERNIMAYEGYTPRRATDVEALGDDEIDYIRTVASSIQIGNGSIDVDPETIDLSFGETNGSYSVVTGDLDAAGIEDQISDAVERTESHDGTTINVLNVETDYEKEIYHGIGVSDDHLVVTLAPSGDDAVEFVRAFLKTRYGEFEQYTDSSDHSSNVDEQLPDGFHYSAMDVPDYPSASSYWSDGDDVTLTTVARPMESDDSDPEDVEESMENESAYADVSARTEGSLIVSEATVTDYGVE